MSITRAGSSPATHIDRMDLKAKDYDDQQKLASKYTLIMDGNCTCWIEECTMSLSWMVRDG